MRGVLNRRGAAAFLLTTMVVAITPVVTGTAGSAASATARPAAIPFTEANVTQTVDAAGAPTDAVAWAAPKSAGKVTVYAGQDPRALEDDPTTGRQVGEGAATGTVDVSGLAAAPRWYFALDPAKGGTLVVADRSLHLAASPNFRDAGGYRTKDGKWVRMGVLYRSDAIDKLTDADLATLEALDVKLVCDLRTDYERGRAPDKAIPGAEDVVLDVAGNSDLTKQITEAILNRDAAAINTLLGDGKGAQLLTQGGRSYVSSDTAKAAYTAMFERIGDPAQVPAVYHCSGGKDRTGWASAAVLTALGVPRATVVADYLKSNDYLAPGNEKTLALVSAIGIDRTVLEPTITVSQPYLDASFAEVKAKYGTFDQYLTKGLGVTPKELASLKQEMLAG
jgi:protein-tyrosine phosphatase